MSAGRGWAYAGAMLGGVVSIAANIAHSYVPPAESPQGWAPEPGAVIGAVFWPVALVVAVEILARTAWPEGRRWLALRFAGLLPVAVVAAMVSYRHLSGLLAFYGEDAITSRVGPLAVDGLMVMASGALLAIAARRGSSAGGTDKPAETTEPTTATAEPDPAPSPDTTSTTASPAPPRPATPARMPARSGGTADAVARLRRRHPDLPSVEIARRLGVSDRTVRRHLAATRTDSTTDSTTTTDVRTEPAADAAPVAA